MPITGPVVTVGASGLTVTSSVATFELVLPAPSVAVTVTLSVKFVSLGGVIVRLDSVQPATLTEVIPLEAVKVWASVPSVSFAPTGIPPTMSEVRLTLDALSVAEAAMVPSEIAVPSVPASVPGDQDTLVIGAVVSICRVPAGL